MDSKLVGSGTYEEIEVDEGLVELFLQDIEPSEADVCGCHVGQEEATFFVVVVVLLGCLGVPGGNWRTLRGGGGGVIRVGEAREEK